MAGATKCAFSPKISFGSPRIDSWLRLILFRSFSDPGGYFFCSGGIFGNFDVLFCFGCYVLMIFYNFLALFFASAVHFVRQDSGRDRQESVKILAETAKILINFFTYTSARNLVECGGLRVCEQNPPHSAVSAGVL